MDPFGGGGGAESDGVERGWRVRPRAKFGGGGVSRFLVLTILLNCESIVFMHISCPVRTMVCPRLFISTIYFVLYEFALLFLLIPLSCPSGALLSTAG